MHSADEIHPGQIGSEAIEAAMAAEPSDLHRRACTALLNQRLSTRPCTTSDVLNARFQQDWAIERETNRQLRAMRAEVRRQVAASVEGHAA